VKSKPFSVRELVARIRTVLRRATAYPTDFANKKELVFKTLNLISQKGQYSNWLNSVAVALHLGQIYNFMN